MFPIFTTETIRRALAEAEKAPPGHGTALIEVEASGRMRAVITERIDKHWTVAGEIAWSTDHPKPEGFVGLRASW